MSRVSIYDFYKEKSILITGATGFVGKVIIEKILRSLSNISNIYILVRPKQNRTVEERLTDLLNSPLFCCVRKKEDGSGNNLLDKIVAVHGDLLMEDMGLSEQDKLMLINNVNIVFHSAATVRFDEPFKLAVEMNILGTIKVLDLCKSMKCLESFVHVSTAFCNCNLKEIEEVVYPPLVNPQYVIDLLQWMDNGMLDKITSNIIDKHPNTYTFTKQLSESIVNNWAKINAIPTAIVRPSIITATFKEPFEGFIDNFNGPSSLIVAYNKGLLRNLKCIPNDTADVVPVDVVSNLLIVAAHEAHNRFKACLDMHGHDKSNMELSPVVYNCTTGQIKRTTWGQLINGIAETSKEYPFNDIIRLPKASIISNTFMSNLYSFFDHKVASLFLDAWMYISCRKVVFYRVNQRIQHLISALQYFIKNKWVFHNKELLLLLYKLPANERSDFDFDMKKIIWNEYIKSYCIGLKKYALNEDVEKMEKAKSQVKRLQNIGFVINASLFLILWRIFVKRFACIGNVWKIMLQLALKIFSKIPSLAK